jgi:hypothetical protein
LSFELRASSFVLLVACGSSQQQAGEPAVLQLPPSPTTTTTAASTTSSARAGAPDRAAVLDFCEQYRRAMEARDADALMALVSKRYSDNGVTYDTLRTSMHRLMSSANQIRYEIRYGDVTPRADGAIEVDFHYTASFLTAGGWQHRVEDAKLVLERRGSSFAFLSGM